MQYKEQLLQGTKLPSLRSSQGKGREEIKREKTAGKE